MMYGRARWQEAEAIRKDFNIVLIRQDKKFLYLRALQGQSGRNPIDPSLQDNVLIPDNFFEYIYLFGCAVNFTLHHKFRIDSGRTKNLAGTDRRCSLQPWILWTKNHQDPKELDLTKPRLASYKQKWKVHQDTVYWVDIQLAQREGLKFYHTRSNAVIFYDTLPACCISKAIVIKSEEIIYQKVYVSLRPPPTIS